MKLKIALTHRTDYRYDRPVALGPHVVRLRPAPYCRTPILSYALRVEPVRHFLNWLQDPFGNYAARVVVPERTDAFSVTVDVLADMTAINPFDFFVDEAAVRWPFTYEASLAGDLRPYLERSADTPALRQYLEAVAAPEPVGTIDFITRLNRALSQHVDYRTRMEPGVQTPEETLAARSGSCRDTSWLLVQLLRRLGLAARFVSGYLIQLRTDAPAAAGPEGAAAGVAEDSADLHAWAEVYIPGAGWIGLDPTSGLLTAEGHIPLAATPSPVSAAPVSGTHDVADVDFAVSVRVMRLDEVPRVSAPYGDVEWQAILATGAVVEERLQAGDVRLSMGGEPTFVAVGDSAAPEWNIAALGPTKRRLADKLARRLSTRFAAGGGLLHYGHGKWYPGETAARWAFGIHWRSDGVPLWRDASLIAEETADPPSMADAERFAGELARALGLPGGSAIPAYEDAAHYQRAEQMLPPGETPDTDTLVEPAERARLARVTAHGLGRPVGYVLPLLVIDAEQGARRFISERWAFRRGQLLLVPGDSPIGLRLPLAGLAQIDFVDYPHVLPADPFADPGQLPAARAGDDVRDGGRHLASTPEIRTEVGREGLGPASNGEASDSGSIVAMPPAQPVRTALAIEVRDGHLCVFLPPLADGADYTALIGAIEATAARLRQVIRLEGYPPPFDARLRCIKVTPDPGVIEVNVHPAASWDETVAITTAVYEEAERVGLGAEKFRSDGRHVGTGGGNHVVLGGLTPADSPFLRRPDLLASLIQYWQNHPSLSYLFAGQFVGPTSQAPRVDEARHEALYELEIALRQLPGPAGGAIAPWLVDRLFRNLLVDATGNTHRAEICIDKLYSPDGPMGRLGLVELRAFEMPPHARMSVAQQLLVRALVAGFWVNPYRKGFVRWGTMLHDRFMLPRFVWADFESVIADLGAAGLPLEAGWFRPHFEFRFPVVGAIEREGVSLELRRALEPWLVLGEHAGAAGTSRPVDASLERLQVLVNAPAGGRYVVACNGFVVPLAATDVAGERAAGIRFRAWRAANGLHPTIPPHVPLTFDIVDTWNARSVGGCRIHVTRPDGRDAEMLPVNAMEAEARRAALFEVTGHTPGGVAFKAAGVHPDFPLTLDLRRIS
jgi:uncharacterized protein (DUF2126 family)/transglutaminase-like putative cysteine protease